MRVESPTVSFIFTILVLSPLPWHWRARNIPTLSLIFWLAAINLIHGINAIAWAGNVINHAPAWCDITTKLQVGAHHAYAASAVCVCRTLAYVGSPCYTKPSAAQRGAQVKFEIFMCVVWPAIGMILHFVVQGHRFNILENLGCDPAINVSLPAILIVYLPPIVWGLVSLVYSTISLRWLIHSRERFQKALLSGSSSLTIRRYIRLVALSVTLMVSVTALTVFVLVYKFSLDGIQSWISWDFVHTNWDALGQYAKVTVAESFWLRHTMLWYMVSLTSVIFFAFFGLGKEARTEYARCINFVKTKLFRTKHKDQPVLPLSANNGISITSPTSTTRSDDLKSSPGA